MARLDFKDGLFVLGTDFKENYAFLREYDNSTWESFCKAWLVRFGIPVDCEPGISYSTAIWRQVIKWVP